MPENRSVSQFDILVRDTARFVAIRVDSYHEGDGIGLGTIAYRAAGNPGELDMWGGGGSGNAVASRSPAHEPQWVMTTAMCNAV